ncbi:MAG: hypothetical protein Q8Q26_13415 [Pseudorhodobacter sp.]|nr:hypothetical protein [Pseudorhodobacter sp.]
MSRFRLTFVKATGPDRRYQAPMLHRTMPLALSLVLALALVVGGMVRGLAQPGAMTFTASLTAMVICADGAEATVLLNAQGNVIDADQPCLPLHCSQCLLAGAVALASPGFAPEGHRPAVRPTQPEPVLVAMTRRPLRTVARGPPLVKV